MSNLPRISLSEALVMMESIWTVWGDVNAFGILSPSTEMDMVRLFVPVLRALVSNPSCTEQDLGSLAIVQRDIKVRFWVFLLASIRSI